MDSSQQSQPAQLLPVLHQKLIALLQRLTPYDWNRETVCAGWLVKDVASHLLDTSLRTIALYRDAYLAPDKPQSYHYQDIVDHLNRLNNDWVRATRRLSPELLLDWLTQAGHEADALLLALAPDEPAIFPVAWAGQQVSSNQFHLAREYTERWHHQQQIRLAVGQTAELETDLLYRPLLDTFMQALPHAYRATPAPVGTLLHFSVTNLADGDWFLRREAGSWTLRPHAQGTRPDTIVRINRPHAWQLFTRNLPLAVAATYIQVDGDPALGNQLLTMRSVMM